MEAGTAEVTTGEERNGGPCKQDKIHVFKGQRHGLKDGVA